MRILAETLRRSSSTRKNGLDGRVLLGVEVDGALVGVCDGRGVAVLAGVVNTVVAGLGDFVCDLKVVGPIVVAVIGAAVVNFFVVLVVKDFKYPGGGW